MVAARMWLANLTPADVLNAKLFEADTQAGLKQVCECESVCDSVYVGVRMCDVWSTTICV
jgi:hypothetical protein